MAENEDHMASRDPSQHPVSSLLGEDSRPFEKMEAGDDGWSEWRRPLPGYLMKCCDCGLVHEMDFAVVRRGRPLGDGYFESEDVEDPSVFVMFRARRADGGESVQLGDSGMNQKDPPQ